MAAHLRINNSDDLALAQIALNIERMVRRVHGHLKTSMKWVELPADYLEGDDTGVFWAMYSVPNSVVAGGKATIELHINGDKTNNIYLVA